jgi:type IV secretion system protein VirB8
MTKVPAKIVDDYFRQATEWDVDQVQRSKKSERRAWTVAGVAGVIALLCAGANYMLFPLKQIEYRIVRVDDTTGVVDVQRTTLSDAKTTYKEATDKYWLRLYVRMREHYLYDEYDTTYRTVGLLSSGQEQKKWHAYWNATNPAAPVNQYGTRARVKVKIRSVTFIGKNLANVHYTKILEQGNARPVESYWIATIPYRYVNEPVSDEDREINPIGFQVTEGYRSDPETDITRTAEVSK